MSAKQPGENRPLPARWLCFLIGLHTGWLVGWTLALVFFAERPHG